jgi:hypothetical protein
MLCFGGNYFWGFHTYIWAYKHGIRAQGQFWPKRLGLGWGQAGYLGRIGSAGAAVGFSDALKGFFDVFATARPSGFLAEIANYF